jgi:virginiamycin B lyase
VAQVQTVPGSFVPVACGGSIWVSSTAGNLVSRVDPGAHRVTASIAVGRAPRFLTCSENAIWTLNQGDGTVSRIDPTTNRVVATIEVGPGGPGGDIAFGGGFVWVTAVDIPLTQIDPTTNKVVVQFVGPGGDALRVGHGSIWLCSFFLHELWKVPLPV